MLEYVSKTLVGESVKVVGVADLHIGAPTSDFKEFLSQIRDDQYFILLGDVLDLALRDSVGDVYSSVVNPEKQIQIFTDWVGSIRHRVLGVVAGNHELRLKKRFGMTVINELCRVCNIPYSDDILVIDLKLNPTTRGRAKVQYSVVCAHGYTFARGIGGKITGNGRIIDVVKNGDVYLTAHTHQPSVVSVGWFEVDSRHSRLAQRNALLITVPSWLGYEHYCANSFLHPSARGFVEVQFSGDKKLVSAQVRIL